MKAKEYLAKFDADSLVVGDKKAVENLIFAFTDEVTSLIKLRNGRSNEAVKSILRELNQKWNTLCRLDKEKRLTLRKKLIIATAKNSDESFEIIWNLDPNKCPVVDLIALLNIRKAKPQDTLAYLALEADEWLREHMKILKTRFNGKDI